MAAEPSKEPGQDPIESLIDDVIRDILNEASASAAVARGSAPMAALLETTMAAPRAVSRTLVFERLLLAEAFASALAEALVPTLAEALAPRIMKVLEQSTTGEPGRKGSMPAAEPSEQGQHSEAK
jgi:hypothetical protein